MEDLQEAIKIFLKYGNPAYPTACEHDTLYVSINPDSVSEEDTLRLDELGFFASSEFDCFKSFKYGSC